MPQFSLAEFRQFLDQAVPREASGRLCIAFSGGLDSTVLLHAAARIASEHSRYSVLAVHIDHQVHPESPQWQAHCAAQARALGVDYQYRCVTIETELGIEAGARVARYAALQELIDAGDTLLTAHHADDQLETVLLALVRGAGVAGLAAMPVRQKFGRGWHARPLLGFARADLLAWAQAQELHWLADPSNEQRRFDRNYLRHEVIPQLRSRWPAVAGSAGRSAAHLADAAELLAQLAATDLQEVAIGECLDVQRWAGLSAPRRSNVLRHWLHLRGARMPSTRKLASLEHDMLKAGSDRLPQVHWDGFEVRRYRGLLYGQQRMIAFGSQAMRWDWRQPLTLPAGLGVLRTCPAHGQGLAAAKLPDVVAVRFRSGGETLRAAGQAHHRKLKKMLQAADVLPWWRAQLPLLCIGDELAAVGDLWIAAQFAAGDEPGVRIAWEGKPQLTALTS